jgi:hypothetical protein
VTERKTPRGPRRRRTASPVRITHPDGTVVEQPAYTPEQLQRIDRRAAKQPRTWDEINSHAGGGTADTYIRKR